MVPWRATEDGEVTDAVLAWYERFALGQPGVVVVEATGIRDIPSGPLLRIGHDRYVPGLRRLTDRVRRASGGRTRLFIQLIDFLRIRRRPEPAKYFGRFLRVDDGHRTRLRAIGYEPAAHDAALRQQLAELSEAEREHVLTDRELASLRFGDRERVDDDAPHLTDLPARLPGLFAQAARRAAEAGFDGVELHYAHAYTMASFLSARNQRRDGYGTTRAGRIRLPLEVLAAVRETVSAELSVGARILCDEIIEGGSGVDDAAYFATELSRAGLDVLSLSTGGKFEDAKQPKVGEAAYPYTGRSGWECMPTVIADARGPFGRNIAKQAAVRRAIRDANLDTPVVVCGGIHDFDQAEGYLRDGAGDIIGAARQSLADPDWFLKLRLGRGEEIRRCKYTNYCEALDQKHVAVTCQLWDRVDRDAPGVMRSPDGKRRLVAPPWDPAGS